MLETILTTDQNLFLFLNGLRASWLDPVMYWFSNTLVWIPLFLFIAALMIKQWKRQAVFVIIFMILATICTDQTCNVMKRNIKRLRPSHDIEMMDKVQLVEKPNGQLYRGGKFSFPSGHAANSCMLVFIFAFFVRTKKKWPLSLMIVWSLMMAYTRIYLGVHYPLDILCGFMVGSFWGMAFILLWKYNPKFRGEWAKR